MAASLTAPKLLSLSASGSGVGSGATQNKTLRVLVGVVGATPAPDVVVDAQATYQVAQAPAGCQISDVRARVITAFTASVTMTLGDTNAAAGYLSSAKIAPTVADAVGIYTSPKKGTQDAYAGGRKYLTADTVQLVIGGATPVVGLLEIEIDYMDGNCGIV